MPTRAPVTPALVTRLVDALGSKYVVHDEEALEVYAHDETEDLHAMPEVAVRPASTQEVSAVLRLASEHGVPVTPRGGGTGLSGGALPLHGGIALSLDRMDGILEIDVANRMCVVQPGVVTGVLAETVAEHGLYYPPDPASLASCTIGGNIAENAGGPHCVKYGLTRDYVLSLEAVLVDGRVFRTGGMLRKDVAGYDLAQLLVGSEGTLAVVTEAVLRLVPQPVARRLLFAPFATLSDAANAIVAVASSRLTPSVLEILEQRALEIAQAHLGRAVPFADTEAQILLEVDGGDEEAVEREAMQAAEILEGGGALDVVLADSPAKERELWEVRRCLGEAVKKSGMHAECDTSVPPSRVPDLFRAAREVAAEHGVEQVSYGHAGDGNVHVNLLTNDEDSARGRRRLEAAVAETFRRAVALGGTITGEHGVGCAKRPYLPLCRDEVAREVMQRIKQALDPRGLLNPGKAF